MTDAKARIILLCGISRVLFLHGIGIITKAMADAETFFSHSIAIADNINTSMSCNAISNISLMPRPKKFFAWCWHHGKGHGR